MSYTEEKIYHLKDYVEYISELGKSKALKPNTPPVLWFRGERCQEWQLCPSLFRETTSAKTDNRRSLSSERVLQEELRYQHYFARNYHFLNKNPDTKLDWMELMQHHSVKTRLLDWSESMFHSLIFALECFFDEKYTAEQRIDSSPGVWIFEPIEWNRRALNILLSSDDVIDKCIKALLNYKYSEEKIKNRIKNLKSGNLDCLKVEGTEHLENIFNLSIIEKEFASLRQEELLYLLEEGELFNCLFYVLYQVYLTSKLWKRTEVMPLAIVESYHSERIRAQRGAFTIFPYYEGDEQTQSLRNVGINLEAMENMHPCNEFLHKIRICNQEEIAYEVMNAGLNSSWLYPEMPFVANTIENRRVIF